MSYQAARFAPCGTPRALGERVAGNLKKTITRRGDTITTNVDSRGRDTLSVVPTVGTVRRAYAGALDQLTRLWLENAVDSIGGVNPELRWGYDQVGRLKADTSYTGATARSTTYQYDSTERVTTRTDVQGAWGYRYSNVFPVIDSLITPYGDTVGYAFDKYQRRKEMLIEGAGVPFVRKAEWSQVGALLRIRDSVATSPTPYVTGAWYRGFNPDSAGPALIPIWTQQFAAGGTPDTLRDSVTYDGWERVNAVVMERGGSGVYTVAARDTFRFNRTADILTTAGAEVYDAATGRLTQRTEGSGTWSYAYDRAGNLTRAVYTATGVNDTLVYAYDALNQLRTVWKNGTGIVARYAYDLAGRRIAKRVYSAATGGVTGYTRFVYAGADVAYETDSVGTIGLSYTWGTGTDDLVAIRDTGGNHYYVTQDLLGSVRGLVKQDGTWTRTLRYGAYGAVVFDSAASGAPSWEFRYRWTGREYDAETGFYFHRSRYYDAAQRRFVQEDKIGYAGGWNLYGYAGGSVLDVRDPFGTSPDPCAGPIGCLAPVSINALASMSAMERYFLEMMLGTYSFIQSFEDGSFCSEDGCVFIAPVEQQEGVQQAARKGPKPEPKPVLQRIVCGVLSAFGPITASYGVAADGIAMVGSSHAVGLFIGSEGIGSWYRMGVAAGYDVGIGGEAALTLGTFGGFSDFDVAGGISGSVAAVGVASSPTSWTGSYQTGPNLFRANWRAGVSYTFKTALLNCR